MDIINTIVSMIGWIVLFHFCVTVITILRQRNNDSYSPEYFQPPPKEITVEITKEGDQIYFWNEESGVFLAQGKDIEEIFDKCSLSYPNTKFYIPKEKAKEIGLSMNV